MDRSRADDILREWSTVARSAHRPFFAPRPHVTRSALPLGLLAGGALVIAVVLGLNLWSRNNPTAASGSPSASPSASPTDSGSPASSSATPPTSQTPSPTEEPIATPTLAAGARRPNVVATAACGAFTEQSSPVVSGSTIYAACDPEGTTWPAVHAIDATTGKTIAVYDVNDPIVTGQYLVVDNGLWFSNSNYGACSNGQCQPWTQHVRKMDLGSKKVTFSIDGWYVFGDGFSYVWAASNNALMKIDPVTTRTSQIAWKSGTPQIACGSLWGLKSTFTADNKPIDTTIVRVDPATGDILATFTEPGSVFDLQQTSDGCWGIELVAPGDQAPAPEASGPTQTERFVKIGLSGIESRSASFTWSLYSGRLLMLDGTFWIWDETDPSSRYLQRVDPASWQRVGPVWVPPVEYWESPIVAGGAIWVQVDFQLERLDIPLGPIAP